MQNILILKFHTFRTCQEEVLNDLCITAPETVPNSDEKPRATCFENGKRICQEKYFSGSKISG